MANLAAKVTAAFFDSHGLHYDLLGDDQEAIIAGFAMENREGIRVLMYFDSNNASVKIRTQNLVKFDASKKEKMYKVCNELNARFRWVKFFVDENDNTITAEDDAIIQLDSCGEEVFRCCLQLTKISDDAYPYFMRAIWS